jgi:hypothetical protein
MNATISLTEEEAKVLSSLLSQITGKIQYKALKDPSLDESWVFWHGISSKVSESIGFESFMEDSEHLDVVAKL